MSTGNPTCEEFEIAALKRAHGALDAEGTARLDAHLATCASCRRFGATDAAAATALRRRAHEAAATRYLDETRAAMRAQIRRDRLRLLAWPVLAALFPPAFIALGLPRDRWNAAEMVILSVIAMAIATVAIAVSYFQRRRWERRAESLGAAQFLRFHRDSLDREISDPRTRRMRALATLFSLAVVQVSLLGSGNLEELTFWLVVDAYVLGFYCYRSFVLVPRLERERRELGK